MFDDSVFLEALSESLFGGVPCQAADWLVCIRGVRGIEGNTRCRGFSFLSGSDEIDRR